MKAATRNKLTKLTTILDRHAAAEQRTLADIRNAGYQFTTVDAARRFLKARVTIDSNPDEAASLIAEIATPPRYEPMKAVVSGSTPRSTR